MYTILTLSLSHTHTHHTHSSLIFPSPLRLPPFPLHPPLHPPHNLTLLLDAGQSGARRCGAGQAAARGGGGGPRSPPAPSTCPSPRLCQRASARQLERWWAGKEEGVDRLPTK
eukprot:547713-Rhodomonas_salina.1